MNLLIYLRFLRPLRSLFLIALYTGVAGNWGHNLLSLDQGTAWFIALTVAQPLLLGHFIAGAAHEPMHRLFALILPNLRRRQRTAAAVSILVATLATMCAATWANPSVSPLATFGLGCALMTLPSIDRHQRLGGQCRGVLSFLGWLSLVEMGGAKLPSIMNAAPWLFLLGGLTVAAVSLVLAFSRESLRARAGTLFIAYQTNAFSYLFHRGMVARWQAELTARKSRKKKVPSSTSRDWEVRSVGATSLDWMRVFWHANFGASRWRTFFGVQLGFAALTLAYAAGLAYLNHIFSHSDYWATLALIIEPEKLRTVGLTAGIWSLARLLQPMMAMLFASLVITPQFAYPLSRDRQARCVFWQAASQWASALVTPATVIFLASLAGQVGSGEFLPGYGLPALIAGALPLAALLPLLAAAGTVRSPLPRLFANTFIVATITTVGITRPFWGTSVLSPTGVLSLLVATAGAQWLLWRWLRFQYATSDLPLEQGLAFGLAGSR